MKNLLLPLFALTLGACNIQFGSIQKNTFNSTATHTTASIKYAKSGIDSLRVKTRQENFTVALPQRGIRFSVICKTSEDVILQSFDKTKILIFILKTKKWSAVKEVPKDCP